MSESHTKGPWRVDETRALGAYGVWTAYPTHPGHNGEGYPSQICSMRPTTVSQEITREQRDANARLIAAAPSLLAACEGVVSALPVCDPAFQSVLEMCRAAVALARGEGETNG